MKVLRLEEARALEQAISVVQHGGVIAFPTDTVYGIGASLSHPDALSRIFEIKGRDRDRPLPILLSSPGDITRVGRDVPAALLDLATGFWPGPLTIAIPAAAGLPAAVIATDGTIGVRVPDHSVALTIANRCGGAVAATSANLSGQPPACSADDVAEHLLERLDLVLDGGIAPCSLASTVIRLEGDTISILREGVIPGARIREAWARLQSAQRDTGAQDAADITITGAARGST